MLLYQRATGNRLLRKEFYTLEGATRLLSRLKGDDGASSAHREVISSLS
jgi:hypothetical protein